MGPALDHVEGTLRAISGVVLSYIDPLQNHGHDLELLHMGMALLKPSNTAVTVEESLFRERAATLEEHLRVYEAQRQRDMEEQRGLGLRL